MPFLMLLASCDSDSDLNGIMQHQQWWHHMMQMPVAIVSHDQKSHVTSNFNSFDQKNVMVTLRLLITSCDANTSANGMT